MNNQLIRQLHQISLKEESINDKISRKTKAEIEEMLQDAESGEFEEYRREHGQS